jgi:sulfatase modifying factor 1
VVNIGKELGESCTADSQCGSRSCSLGDVSNNSGFSTIGPLPGTGVWPALPTAVKVCTPTPDSAWPSGLPDTRTDMVLIPAGTFIMGSPTTEKWRTFVTSSYYGEESQHRVTISRPFYLQRLEITEGAWARVTGRTRNTATWADPNGSPYPLIYTDYYSAVGFANELSRREGLTECYTVTCQAASVNSWVNGAINPDECSAVALTSASCTGYRLPTESEWEYAARAGTKGAVYYDPNGDGQAENIALNSVASWGIVGWGQAQPGGRAAPNPWGLYDMIGNNWEYVHDSYAAYPTATNSTDPGLSSPASKAAILRGGSYGDNNVFNRASTRHNWSANGSLGDARSNYGNVNVGFRLARTAITPLSAGTPCAPGYHVSGNICDVDQIACYVEHATAAKQTWNGTAFGDCIATACATGFHVEEGACLSNTKTCSNASGTGLQKWTSGTTYGSCLQPLGGLCAANGDCDGNAQNLAYCPAATSGLPERRCAPTGMIYLPPATYTAGSPTNEAWSEGGENLFQATISRGLFIGTTEVTQAQWKALSDGKNPSCNQNGTAPWNVCGGANANDNGPVENVNWFAAAAFANARSIAEGLTPCYERRQYDNTYNGYDADWRDGNGIQVTSLATIACDGYRLPTDAEWEYAARAGSRGPAYNVPNGSASVSAANLNAISWNNNNAAGYSRAVGLKAANAFGLYDMLGNMFEWSHDVASANPTTAQTDPIEHGTWGETKHLRGAGLTRNNTSGLRSAYLFPWGAQNLDGATGLRLVRTPVLTALRGLCPSGYHAVGTLCEPDLLACATTATNAVGTAKSWNAATSSFGACLPYTCATGFHLEGGACLSNSKTCTVGSQTGVQDWSAGTTYSVCKLPLGALCTTDADCASTTLAPTYCATGPTGTANDRCAPAGMNYIPAGTFVMGSPAAETYRVADEIQHQVTLTRPFFMGAREVTQAEWTRLAGDYNPACFQTTTGAACAGGNLNPTGPVERVDWYAAVGYANARSESEGLTPCYSYSVTRSEAWVEGDHIFSLATPPGSYLPTLNCTGYRLPTEAEWEYAARAGTTGVIYNAANPLAATQSELNLIAWNANNAGGRTQAVGTRQANAWGLFDMLGNVYEYQWDVFAAYPTTAVTDPLGAVNGWRGIKGRGYTDTLDGYAMRAAMRFNWDPANGNGNTNIGLRLVRTAVLPVAQAGSAALGVAEAACPTGYHVNTANNVCDADTIACSSSTPPANATALTQLWNGTAYGSCNIPTACTAGFHLEAGACVSDTKSCNNVYGTGLQAWNGTTYGSCLQPLGGLCTLNSDCFVGQCATGPAGTANDRCAPAGMNYIPAGTFTMGSPAGEVGRLTDETEHSVTISRAFFLGQTEATQAQWKALSGGTNPSCFQSTTGTACTTSSANDSGPAEGMDWYAAVAFANARSAAEGLTSCYTLTGCTEAANGWKDGIHTGCTGATFAGLTCTGYRLPTESEWEYAARGGTTTATYLGNLSGIVTNYTTAQPNLDGIAWWGINGGRRTQAVGSKTPNNYGLSDMLGNAFEWTGDLYGTYPGTVADPTGATTGSTRVARGASWNSYARSARAASRSAPPPTYIANDLGFRLARTVP